MEKLWQGEPPYWDGSIQQETPSIELYLLPGDTIRPCVVVFAGGGYQMKADHEKGPIAERLNLAGFNAVVVDYRVAPYRHPAPLCDAQRALRLVRSRAEEWHVDPAKIGILGFSAGGHLCATLSTRYADDARGDHRGDAIDRFSARPDFAVLCYPVISFTEFGHSGSMKNLLGPEPPWHLRRNLSAELQVSSATPPTFLWHTGDDEAVPVENSLAYAAALRSSGVPFELHVYPHGRHGLGLAADNARIAGWIDLCAGWIDSL